MNNFVRPILVGQVWRDNSLYGNGTFRIMAVAERYAMARRKGAMPFVISFGDLRKRAELVDTNKEQP